MMRPSVAVLLLLATGAFGQPRVEEGKRIFNSDAQPACALCHALKAAGAEGAIGPSLDELKPDAARVAKAIKNGIGQMPAFTQLSEAQVQEVSRYVELATR